MLGVVDCGAGRLSEVPLMLLADGSVKLSLRNNALMVPCPAARSALSSVVATAQNLPPAPLLHPPFHDPKPCLPQGLLGWFQCHAVTASVLLCLALFGY